MNMAPNNLSKSSTTLVKSIKSEKESTVHPYVSLSLNCDVVLWFDVKDSTKPPVTRAKHKIMKQLIEAVLVRGVGDRINNLTFGKRNDQGKIVFGFNINPEASMVNYIKGPSIDSTEEAGEFRKFWNNLTECRRYPDLSTCETVFISVDSVSQRREITVKFVKMLLDIHLGIPQSSVKTIGQDINNLLKTNIAYIGTGDEEINKVNYVLEELIKKLRTIRSDSLEIHSLQGISPVCRATEVKPPLADCFSPLHGSDHEVVNGFTIFKSKTPLHLPPVKVEPIEVLLQLEVSGIYTDEIEILRAKKVQMIIELCQLIDAQVGLKCKPSSTYIDVLCSGLVFRLIIVITREVSLLRQVKSSLSVLKESLSSNREAEELHIRNEILPKYTASINAIATRYISFSPVCRLVKRWISSHCLLDFFTQESIELIVASVFIDPEPYSKAPNLPVTGLIRCLDLLANFKFSTKPFIVNLNDLMTVNDIANVEKVFESTKNKPGMFIVTPYDRNYGMFSRQNGFINSTLMVSRLQTLASEWLKSIFLKISNLACPIDLSPMFVSTVTDAHVIIHLKGKFFHGSSLSLARNDSNSIESFPIVDFDPVNEYIKILRKNYDSYALFMHDKYFGDVIYVFWKAEAFQNVKDLFCNVDLVQSTNLSSHVPNLEAIIENLQLLGLGIVQRVVVKSENWPV